MLNFCFASFREILLVSVKFLCVSASSEVILKLLGMPVVAFTGERFTCVGETFAKPSWDLIGLTFTSDVDEPQPIP